MNICDTYINLKKIAICFLGILYIVFIHPVSAQNDCSFKSNLINADKHQQMKPFALKALYDVKQYILHLQINPDTLYIKGSVTIIFQTENLPIQLFDIHLTNSLITDSVSYHRQSIPFLHQQGMILSSLPLSIPSHSIDSITIYYHGSPNGTGGLNSFAKGSHSGGNAIYTLSQPYGASDWWPCKNTLDDKADSLDIYIEVPDSFQTATNGLLIDSMNTGHSTIYHWKHRYPIATYLIAIAVSKYIISSDYIKFSSNDSIPYVNYIYSSSYSTAIPQISKLKKSIELFSNIFGKYPFSKEKYGHAQFGWGGGMEHQTMSFVGNFGQDLLIHELAHQWFGDKVTCGSWVDLWLNEGFATYLTGISKEKLDTNAQSFKDWKALSVDMILRQPGGSIYNLDTLSINRLFDSRLTYTKSSMVLHMLRKIVGDSAFFKACNNYLLHSSYGFVYTSNLIHEMELESGKDLKYFFSQWFYGEGYPIYNIVWQQKPNANISIDLYQRSSVNTVDFYRLPVTIRFMKGNQFRDITLNHEYHAQQFDVTLPFEPDIAIFNPEFDIVAEGFIEQKGKIAGNGKSPVIFYPINGSGNLSFEVTNGLTILEMELIDINGKIIYSWTTSKPLNYGEVLVNNLASSLYFMRCRLSDGSEETVKIPIWH